MQKKNVRSAKGQVFLVLYPFLNPGFMSFRLYICSIQYIILQEQRALEGSREHQYPAFFFGRQAGWSGKAAQNLHIVVGTSAAWSLHDVFLLIVRLNLRTK